MRSALMDSVRLVHGRDTCDEAGRPLTTFICSYHEGFSDALDLWSWQARQVTPCESVGHDHSPAGVHVIVRCVCEASFMSTDAGVALGMAQSHEHKEAMQRV